MSTVSDASGTTGWPSAVRTVGRWLDKRERIDAVLETLPPTLRGAERARCQSLVFGVVRHYARIAAALEPLISRPPRLVTQAILFVAGYEIVEAGRDAATAAGRLARIGHHAVEQTKALASDAEARLVNAVVRKLGPRLILPAPEAEAGPDQLAEYFSHPGWLVRAWAAQFGREATRTLLEWNQEPAPVYARWRATAEPPPDFLKPTRWERFYEVGSGHWSEIEPLLSAGKLYLQDPSTRLPVDLLEPRENESLLDLCAAPGGKSLLIADSMVRGRLTAVDVPTARIDRLKENLSRTGEVQAALVQADVLRDLGAILREHRLPTSYDGVLIDVPCSNTGVMRHRIDVKWRLQPGDFKKHPLQQRTMLGAAARFVAPGGRLVYSTCSIDAEENEHVVREFLGGPSGAAFALERTVLSYPWVDRHDGGGAFLLRRKAAAEK